jgi:hypothetical protein
MVTRWLQSSRTAAGYSNPCVLPLSWAGFPSQTMLRCLTARRVVPVVCIQAVTGSAASAHLCTHRGSRTYI